jgi:CRISPR-associated protein Csb2
VLAIEVEYLMGRSYATDFRDDRLPEWPPHPDRLFEALVAAYHDDPFPEDGERSVLRWLETLGAPQIAAGEAGHTSPVVNFVPTNYNGKSGSPHPDQRGRQPRMFPVQSPSSPIVQFIWPDAKVDETTSDRLRNLLARVPSLGRACSLVRMGLGESPIAPVYIPDPEGGEVLRVFGEGRLDELETLYKLDKRPSLGPQMRYGRARAEIPVPESSFGEMIVLRRIEGRGLSIEAALTLTSALRRALMKLSENDPALCAFFSGHDAETHCAFAALPFVGHEHADGRLMGVAVVLPRTITTARRRKVLRACALVEKVNLKDESAFWEVELCGFDIPQRTLQPQAWSSSSATWASVTPILLDRFPKKNLSVEEILAAACERVGLPQPIEIEHGPFSDVPGVSPVSEFRLQRNQGDKPRWGVHARFRFEEPVHGPILLGAGRFFGLGLLRPSKWRAGEPNVG